MALKVPQDDAEVSADVSREVGAPSRLVVVHRARRLVLLTAIVDLLAVMAAYAFARAATRDVGLLSPFDRRVLITIPFWLIVFLAFGLYKRKYVLEPSARIPVVLSA